VFIEAESFKPLSDSLVSLRPYGDAYGFIFIEEELGTKLLREIS